MSTAVMALAETSKAYQRKIRELEDEVARLQAMVDKRDARIVELRTEGEGLRCNNGKLDWEVKKLRGDCSEARGYGQALYECLRKAYDGLGQVPEPPWLVGE